MSGDKLKNSIEHTFKWALLSLLFLTMFTTHAQELSLKHAYDLMLSTNGDLKASSFENEAVKEEEKATKGLRYPSVSIMGSYITLADDVTLDLNPAQDIIGGIIGGLPEGGLGDWNFTLQEQNFGFAAANVTWPIFAGGKINEANKAAALKSDISENQHHLKEDQFTANLIDYYYKLKLATEALDLYTSVLETVKIHNDHAEKLFKNGIIPEVETLNAKVALSNAKRELLGAEKDVSLAKTAIQNLIGGETFSSVSTEFMPPIILPPLEEFQQDMLSNNKQLLQIEQNYQLAKIGVKVEKSDYFPQVGVFAGYLLWTDNLPLLDDYRWAAGVGLSWDIFDGFTREHKIKASQHKVSQVEEIDKQARLNILTYTEKLYREIQKQQEQYESLDSDEALAEKLKFMRTRGFEEGTGTSLEVIDATLQLNKIKLLKLKALYQYNVTYGQLMIHLGETTSFLNKN
ncbi:TolC family protein [Formosa sp. PL04]|uniref:TolC family protein n=1 Tax=Formosa sp. PL04 TaxID=3081755 RepID=UPI002981CCA3|nr:TolC family protein [Formosa sp. PL04]MDW5290254.1 TolC family protein [Formosa sp. PL04]